MAGTSPNETGPEPRSRAIKHVTRACIGCQRRKTKCDGVKPQCATCSLYKQECTFSQEIDRRRMASKGRISLLVAYVQDLESLLLRHQIPLPPSRPKHFLPAVSTSSPVNDAEPMLNAPTQNADDQTATTVEHGISIVSNQSTPETHDQLSISGESSYMSPLSDRMGSLQIAEDGQLRFFGPTSNLHISHVGPFPLFNSNIRSVHWNEALILKAAGVGHDVEGELEDHLTNLYFTWENPNIPLVDEATYYQEKDRYRRLNQPSHRYSEVLNNAICAVGAALTSRYCSDLPEALVDFFATRSKALLEVEMDSPTLSTVQSLGILSGVEALLTRDARGWLYSGMAMRLATDLGLHIDATPFAERGLMDVDELRLRSSTFWGTYIHERMWSLYVGRPESIDHLDITVQLPFPSDSCSEANKTWRPYIDEDQQGTAWEVPARLNDVAQATIVLCNKMASIRKILYCTPRGKPLDMKKLYTFAVKARNDLAVWLSSLSEPLVVDMMDLERKHLPHVMQLHMQFHAVRIIVDQPFAFQSVGRDGLTGQEIQSSRECCHDAAWSITKLVQATRRHFSLRRVNIQAVHSIFTTMLVHVHSAFLSPDYQVRDTARRQLEICSQALGEIGQAYKNALRALEVITSIKSDLLRRDLGTSAIDIGIDMIGQPTSMMSLAQVPSVLFGADVGSSHSWSAGYTGGGMLDGFDIRPEGDLEKNASFTGQLPLPGQSSWESLTESLVTSHTADHPIP